MEFNADREAARVIKWARAFLTGTEGKPVVIGISGGKDSTITAAALVEAVGPHRILGVLLPNGNQSDIQVSRDVCKFLQIQSVELNIGPMYKGMIDMMKQRVANLRTEQINSVVETNAPCRCRTVMLYSLANQFHGRVANTCNMSESFVGYDTKWGDQCGDFNLFQDYTASEVKQMGYSLGVLPEFIEKAPDDGMCGQTDEERWGFSYSYLDAWLRRGGKCENETDKKILEMHIGAWHKLAAVHLPHPSYTPVGSHSLLMSPETARDMLSKYNW